REGPHISCGNCDTPSETPRPRRAHNGPFAEASTDPVRVRIHPAKCLIGVVKSVFYTSFDRSIRSVATDLGLAPPLRTPHPLYPPSAVELDDLGQTRDHPAPRNERELIPEGAPIWRSAAFRARQAGWPPVKAEA